MTVLNRISFMRAVTDFRRARRKAKLQRIFSRFSRKSADLLDYQEVLQGLKGVEQGRSVLKDIPIDSIVGSVGRYTDFTRTFLPQKDSDEERWAKVQVAMVSDAGVPPIDVYQIGEAYFVLDGNHRVSVARELGMEFIEAYVREVRTKTPLSPTDNPDDLIIKIEYTNFLERTHLDKLKPDADLSVSVCGTYPTIEEHISVHRYFMGIDEEREVSEEEAVTHWYDEVYLPVIETLRELDILRDFPERTETDLYLWILKHQASLEDELGWEIDLEQAAVDMIDDKSKDPDQVLTRVVNKIYDTLTPDPIETGPPAGEWRESRISRHKMDRLFNDVLTSISGDAAAWRALEQAISIVKKEDGRLRGLHVVPTEEDNTSELTRSIETEFVERCQAAEVEGVFVIDTGGIARTISERAKWNDLLVLHLAHPPSRQPIAKLSSGIRTLIQHCPTPILAVKDEISDFERALLAYDGSPKAKEALYIASYFASRWGMALSILAVNESGEKTDSLLQEASEYLGLCGTEGILIEKSGSTAVRIIETAEEKECDLIMMGGIGHSPVLGVVMGSAIDQVMRESAKPILFCR